MGQGRAGMDLSTILRRGSVYLAVGFAMAFLALPNLIVIPISFSDSTLMAFPPSGFSLRWYEQYLELPGWVEATRASFIVATFTTLLATVVGSLAAYGLVRGKYPGKRMLNSFLISPIMLPTLITAVAIFRLYSDLGLIGTILGFVLADSVLAIPFVVTVMVATFKGIDPNLEDAAMTLGATRLTSLRRITIPLALPGVISAALFAFLVAFDELMIAIFISSPTLSTLPKELWEGIRLEITPAIAAVSTLLVLLSVLVLAAVGVSQWLLRRRSLA